jgi:hypothetical protein
VTKPGEVMGTVAYIPLEQLQGQVADERADQFSFCVSLYEIHPRGSQPRDTTRLLAETLGILRGCPLVRSGRESTWVDGSRHRSSKILRDVIARDRGASVATRAPVATPCGLPCPAGLRGQRPPPGPRGQPWASAAGSARPSRGLDPDGGRTALDSSLVPRGASTEPVRPPTGSFLDQLGLFLCLSLAQRCRLDRAPQRAFKDLPLSFA